PLLAQSGGPGMSALAPLLGAKQTSAIRFHLLENLRRSIESALVRDLTEQFDAAFAVLVLRNFAHPLCGFGRRHQLIPKRFLRSKSAASFSSSALASVPFAMTELRCSWTFHTTFTARNSFSRAAVSFALV